MQRNQYKLKNYTLSPVLDFSIFTGFSCCQEDEEDRDLDDFIHNDAERHYKDKMAVTYSLTVTTDEPIPTLAFATLQNDAIKIDNRQYPYKSSPAVKIGRLGVSNKLQGMGFGTLCLDMIKHLMCTHNRTGCKYLTLDAYNQPRILKFYERNGFVCLKQPKAGQKQTLMYFDLSRLG